MFDWPQHLREVAQHLYAMSQIPGAVEHARHRLKELSRSAMYESLPELIRQLQKERGNADRN